MDGSRTRRPSLPNPLEPVGYRRDGRPICPILGASSEDDSNKSDGDVGFDGSVTQEDLSWLLAREKTQGGRAAVKKLLGDLGFDNSEALAEFITAKREAEQGALSEVERREQAAEKKLRAAEAREAQAAAREPEGQAWRPGGEGVRAGNPNYPAGGK
ncbi:hypothetical protein ACFYNY_24460 [Streptomyces sp. NPDC006530]|uniref:hypothetical protein n=1 Tax=Streptomyces sp. NPDC006530 TaxID=3364750 RepID=UPI00367BD2C1